MKEKSPWNIYRTRFLVRARQLTEPLTFIDSLGREHSGEPGDYLVETSGGVLRITTKAIFEDIYVPLLTTQLPPTATKTPDRVASELSARQDVARPSALVSTEDRLRAMA
jgi:hypothetical protein